jgi:AraC-like DNA-binding protein
MAGRFEVTGGVSSPWRANVRVRNVAGMSLVACTSDACRGEHSRSTIRAERRRFGVQVALAGTERLTCGDTSVLTPAGSVVVWDSSVPSSFEVPQTLTKATIMFPEALLRERLPRNGPLSDCELVPATIARANGISSRSLHALFHASGTTVAAWLKDQRLVRSRDALNANASGRGSLTEIAFRCGFRDPANFSRFRDALTNSHNGSTP